MERTRFPISYPTLESFIHVSNRLRPHGEDISNPYGLPEFDLSRVSEHRIQEIERLMTPQELLEQTDFPEPPFIKPGTYTSFDEVLQQRERLRLLHLVPGREEHVRQEYKSVSQKEKIQSIRPCIECDAIHMAPTQYPYSLPSDVEQYLIWLQDPNTDRKNIAVFIAGVMELMNLGLDDVILFERPQNTNTKLVKGTIPEFRHVHLWARSI